MRDAAALLEPVKDLQLAGRRDRRRPAHGSRKAPPPHAPDAEEPTRRRRTRLPGARAPPPHSRWSRRPIRPHGADLRLQQPRGTLLRDDRHLQRIVAHRRQPAELTAEGDQRRERIRNFSEAAKPQPVPAPAHALFLNASVSSPASAARLSTPQGGCDGETSGTARSSRLVPSREPAEGLLRLLHVFECHLAGFDRWRP